MQLHKQLVMSSFRLYAVQHSSLLSTPGGSAVILKFYKQVCYIAQHYIGPADKGRKTELKKIVGINKLSITETLVFTYSDNWESCVSLLTNLLNYMDLRMLVQLCRANR